MKCIIYLHYRKGDIMSKKYYVTNEFLSALTHAIGIGLSIWGVCLLMIKGMKLNSGIALISLSIYSITLIALYLFSTLFHTFYFTKLKHFFQCLDHCGISLLIAGTYTPYCVLAIKGKTGSMLLIGIWLLAIGGITYHLFAQKRKQVIETTLYVIMGWFCLFGARPLLQSLNFNETFFLILGGVIFTLGALVYSIKNLKFAHVIWHLLVMGGTLCMFLSLYWFI